MTHEDKIYLNEICVAIEELKRLKPVAARAAAMKDYLYIEKHFAEHAKHMERKEEMHEKPDDDSRKSPFGGAY